MRVPWILIVGAALVAPLLVGCGRTTNAGGRTDAPPAPSTGATTQARCVLVPESLLGAVRAAHEALGISAETVGYPDGGLEAALTERSPDVLVVLGGAEARSASQAAVTGEPVGHVLVAMAVPRGNPAKVKSLADVSRPGTRLAVASSDVDSAAEVFAAASAGSVTIPAPVASRGEALSLLAKHEVDVAVCTLPDLMYGKHKDDCGIGAFLPKGGVHQVDIVVAAVGGAKTASAYAEALRSRPGQDALARFAVTPAVPRAPGDAGTALLVPCGAGLQPAMDEIGAAYLQRTGVRVDFSYAGSGMLMAQLDFTHSGDLYMPGEAFWVTMAERKGLVKDSRAVVYFTPVLAVPEGNPADVRTLEDLARPGVRVALGDPKALAIGPVTKRILEAAGIWEAVQPNVVMFGGCLPELANCIAMKGADVAVLWDATTLQHQDKMDLVPIPPERNEAAEVMLATLTCATDADAARSFLDFVASDEASALFEQNGFRTEPPVGIRLAPREGPDA